MYAVPDDIYYEVIFLQESASGSVFGSFFPNGEVICSPTAVPWMRAVWLKVVEKDTVQKQFSEMAEVHLLAK